MYVFVKFFERLGISKLPDIKQLEHLLQKCVENSQKIINSTSNSTNKANEPTQLIMENTAKNYPFINWIKTNYSNEKKLLIIIKDYEDRLIKISGNGSNSLLNPFISNTNSQIGSSESTNQPSSPIKEAKISFENSTECIYLYLPQLYTSIDIKDNLINSVMTLVKNRQIKILDEEAYLMRKVAIASNQSDSISNQSKIQTNNIYDHYRVYNEIILPNLNTLSKNVKDSVVLFPLDHSDPKILEILRDHPCIPVSPFGRRLKKPNKLIHPMGKIAALYSESDERFPCGSKDTYIRDDRLQILKILGMKSDYLSWQEIVERAESISKIKEYDLAVERSIVILNILNEMLHDNNLLNTVNPTSTTTYNMTANQQNTKKICENKEVTEIRAKF